MVFGQNPGRTRNGRLRFVVSHPCRKKRVRGKDGARRFGSATPGAQSVAPHAAYILVRQMSEKIIALLVAFVTHVIDAGGYVGIAALLAMNSSGIPLPSELIMPFSGALTIYHVNSAGQLALLLSGPAGRPVVDKTGLTGKYDMHLDMGQPGPPSADGSADPGSSIFTVVQEQLGLKLEGVKAPVDVLVIDRAEAPSAN